MKSAKFKDSPLGPIPQDWEVKRLGEIGEPLMCKRVLKHQTSDQGDIPFYKIGTFGKTPDAYISRSLFESLRSKYPFPRKGDCLISAAGTIGRVVVYNGEDAYFQDSNIVWIDNDESVVTNEYLALCYALMKWQSEDGGIISRLYNANLKAQIIVCPPLPEQQRIAEALGEVDKLIESLDEQIEKKRLIAKGVAHDLLSAKKRLPGFKGAWKTRSIEDMLTLGHGRDYKGIPNGDVPVYGTGGVMCYVAEYLYEGPTVCIGRKGTIDAPIYHDGKIWTVDTLFYSHSFKECYPKFIYYKFLTIDWQSYNEASGVPSLTADIIGRISLEVPMNVAEQQAIADLLSEQDAAIAALEEKREKYARIKEGMMRDLLTGKVRMKGE